MWNRIQPDEGLSDENETLLLLLLLLFRRFPVRNNNTYADSKVAQVPAQVTTSLLHTFGCQVHVRMPACVACFHAGSAPLQPKQCCMPHTNIFVSFKL